MKKLKAIIIDDEHLARQLIVEYLKKYEDIDIVDECENGFEGVKAISKFKPDIIFLDIQMPKLNGFEMLELIDESPQVIFTTAYDEYAIKAFEKNAVDYLMKPFSEDRFADAITKAKLRIDNSDELDNEELIKDYSNKETLTRIVVKEKSIINVIPTEEIFYLTAQIDYVKIVSSKGTFLKSKTMSYYSDHLSQDQFIRIHRSTIININYLDKVELLTKDSYVAKMKDGEKLNISKSGYSLLKELL